MAIPRDSRSVVLSDRVYRALVRVYPRRFRRQYRDDMALVFRDSCREAYRHEGVRGLIPLWGRALVDLSINVPKEVGMTLSRPGHPTTKPAQACSSCNNEVVADWRKCIYCGETLIPAVLHDAVAVRPGQRLDMNGAIATAYLKPLKLPKHR